MTRRPEPEIAGPVLRYPLFEFLALTVGSVAIVGPLLLTLWSGPVVVEEAIAQGLLLLVLTGALHKGRKGGLVTAVAATLVYVAMRIPTVMRLGFTSDVASLVLGRVATYALVGIGGGTLVGRIQYFFAHFQSSSGVDEQTQVFNQSYIFHIVRSTIGQYERFHTPFSLVIVSLPSPIGDGSQSGKGPSLRTVAGFIRDRVRLIDEVAHLDDGRFLIVLPQTGPAGAKAVETRLSAGVQRLMKSSAPAVTEVMSAEINLPAIRELCGAPPVEQDADLGRASA
jgi:GGDEF domain-containing protein